MLQNCITERIAEIRNIAEIFHPWLDYLLLLVGWLLVFYDLSIYKVISGWVPTCDRVGVHGDFIQVYSAALWGNQAAGTMT